MNRTASLERNTFETKIKMEINLDGKGKSNINTGVGFFDHMMTHISKHGFIDINLSCDGDLNVDCHHSVEDCGIVFGKLIKDALGDKKGIKRYANAIIPMDEALALCAIDISSRGLLCFDCEFTTDKIGDFDTEMVEEFFRSVCTNAGINMHIKMLAGKNNHHMAEAIFKAFGKALSEAVCIDERIDGVLSTKGMFE